MEKHTIVVFGSFLHYSTHVAHTIFNHPHLNLLAVVTTPPRPAGRQQTLQKTHTHLWTETNNISVFTPEKLTPESLKHLNLPRPDFILSCGYSKLIPQSWLDWPKLAPLNFHPSLLPKYPGTRPAEFAILNNEPRTGVTLHIMDQHYDTGPIVVQQTLPIDPADNRETLYTKLYNLEATLATKILPQWSQYQNLTQDQDSPLALPYARKLSRDDGFIAWKSLQALLSGSSPQKPMSLLAELNLPTTPTTVERAHRALYRYPGIWTIAPTQRGQKRLKLLELKLDQSRLSLSKVQLEGQSPTTFSNLKTTINH